MTKTNTARIALPILSPERQAGSASPSAAPPTAGEAAVRVGMITLGCDKNTVDSERVLARLAGAGARVGRGVEDAEVVVVNTCGFIDMAKEESIETLLDAVRLKRRGGVRAVVAMGCLVQRYKDELLAELPEVDLFLGLTEMDRLLPELRARGLLASGDDAVPLMERPLRLISADSVHSSYLKISEGCDHTCAFCAIPLMRGKHRSTPIEELVREALELQARGVVELNLVSQDTTWYGRDLLRGGAGEGRPAAGGAAAGDYFVGKLFDAMPGPRAAALQGAADASNGGRRSTEGPVRSALAGRHGLLPELLDALLRDTDIPWLRLFYMYPSGIYPELVELIAREPRILPYLDMPIQHGSDRVLKRMRRPERQSTIRERVGWLRDAVPDLVLRTTVIVGFPGEEDEDFESMLELLEELRFDRVGAFGYSVEEGTRAAEMDAQVPDDVIRERLERLLDLQRSISLERNEALVGRRTAALVDRRAEGGVALGRTAGQAPEVDGVVEIHGAAGVSPGDFVDIVITEAMEHDLVAHTEGWRGDGSRR